MNFNNQMHFFCFRGEHLAVRNAEGGFYICLAMQNIYRTSKRIRIQWLSEAQDNNPDKNIFCPEYYDRTEFETILTSLELDKKDIVQGFLRHCSLPTQTCRDGGT